LGVPGPILFFDCNFGDLICPLSPCPPGVAACFFFLSVFLVQSRTGSSREFFPEEKCLTLGPFLFLPQYVIFTLGQFASWLAFLTLEFFAGRPGSSFELVRDFFFSVSRFFRGRPNSTFPPVRLFPPTEFRSGNFVFWLRRHVAMPLFYRETLSSCTFVV